MQQVSSCLVILVLLMSGGDASAQCQWVGCTDSGAPRMKNIGYVMAGYDIYYGNPIPLYNMVDPGTRSLVFAAEYSGDMTPDNRYCTPDGIMVLGCSGNCKLSFDTDTINGKYSYDEKLSGSVGIGGSVGGGEFGASFGWSNVDKMTEGGANIFTMSEVKCCVYTSQMFEFLRPPLHKNFIAGLHSLTDEYNESVYRRFIKAFGTHFVSSSKMGAIWGEQTRITQESWTYMVQNGWNIGVMAKMSAGFSAGLNMSINYNETERESFDRKTEEQLSYSRGAPPPENGKPLTWANSAFDEPNVLGLTLERLDTLFLEEYVSSAVVVNLGKALDEYCPSLVAEGALPNCDPPTPDPPLPKPRIWSHWSNFGDGNDYRAQECDEGDYVEKIQWKYQGHTYGIMDFKMKCAGETVWRSPAIGNHNGQWDPQMNCQEAGFKHLTGREDNIWAGIINVEGKCVDQSLTIHSNDDYRGDYNQELVCTWGRMVGMQVRKKTHHGITNFKILCA